MTTMTCLTFSHAPFKKDTPRSIVYQNYVSVFNDSTGLHAARLDSIFKVKTKYFFFQDDDDPLPNCYPIPEFSLVYGDFHTHDAKTDKHSVHVARPWDAGWHRMNPLMVHKAICNTAMARAVANLLPKGDYQTETMLYYFMAMAYGSTYDPRLKMTWRKRPTGLHTRASTAIINSSTWVRENQDYMMSKLKR